MLLVIGMTVWWGLDPCRRGEGISMAAAVLVSCVCWREGSYSAGRQDQPWEEGEEAVIERST